VRTIQLRRGRYCTGADLATELTRACTPLVIPVVVGGVNFSFVTVLGAVVSTLVPAGRYSPAQLAAFIQRQMTIGSSYGNFTVTAVDGAGCGGFTIATTDGRPFALDFTASVAGSAHIANALGFDPVYVSGASSYTSTREAFCGQSDALTYAPDTSLSLTWTANPLTNALQVSSSRTFPSTTAVVYDVGGGTFSGAAVGTITAAVGNGSVVTYTTSSSHGLLSGNSVTIVMTVLTGFNGTFTVASAPTTTTFTVTSSVGNFVFLKNETGTCTSTADAFRGGSFSGAKSGTITAAVGNGSVVTYTTSSNHGLSSGDSVTIVMTALTEFNGSFTVFEKVANTRFSVTSSALQTSSIGIVSASGTGSIATFTTSIIHGLVAGDLVTVAMTTLTEFNVTSGSIVSVPTTSSFTVASTAINNKTVPHLAQHDLVRIRSTVAPINSMLALVLSEPMSVDQFGLDFGALLAVTDFNRGTMIATPFGRHDFCVHAAPPPREIQFPIEDTSGATILNTTLARPMSEIGRGAAYGPLFEQLGFAPTTVQSSAAGQLMAPNVYSLDPPPYVLLALLSPSIVSERSVFRPSRCDAPQPVLAKFIVTGGYARISEESTHVSLTSPLSVNKVTVAWLNPDGTLVDWNGANHSYSLLFRVIEGKVHGINAD
jgi:hypothetical protein